MLGRCRPRFHAAVRQDGAVAARRRTSASSTRCNPVRRSRRSTISMIAKIISHGATRDEARGKLICGLEQVEAFGVTTNQAFLDRLPAASRLRRRRGDHGFHRRASRRTAGAACGCGVRGGAGGVAALCQQPYAPPWRGGRSLAATFPVAARLESIDGFTRSRSCASATAAMSQAARATHPFEIDELGGDGIRFRRDGRAGIGKIPARRRSALYPAPGRHACRSAISRSPRRNPLRPPAATARFAPP